MGRFSIAELLAPLKGRVPTSSSGDRCGAACPSVPRASLRACALAARPGASGAAGTAVGLGVCSSQVRCASR